MAFVCMEEKQEKREGETGRRSAGYRRWEKMGKVEKGRGLGVDVVGMEMGE